MPLRTGPQPSVILTCYFVSAIAMLILHTVIYEAAQVELSTTLARGNMKGDSLGAEAVVSVRESGWDFARSGWRGHMTAFM